MVDERSIWRQKNRYYRSIWFAGKYLIWNSVKTSILPAINIPPLKLWWFYVEIESNEYKLLGNHTPQVIFELLVYSEEPQFFEITTQFNFWKSARAFPYDFYIE